MLIVWEQTCTVVNSARVSFAKKKYKLEDADEKLIKYLSDHGHWSPFAHCTLQLKIKAPVFVARQLVKHQVGLSWNEVSRRYVDFEPEFWFPEKWHKKAANKKQGCNEDEFANPLMLKHRLPTEAVAIALETYQDMLDNGFAPEEARMVLPQNMMTEWFWTGSLYAFARVCNQRTSKDSQLSGTREVAEKIQKIVKQKFPVSSRYLMKI